MSDDEIDKLMDTICDLEQRNQDLEKSLFLSEQSNTRQRNEHARDAYRLNREINKLKEELAVRPPMAMWNIRRIGFMFISEYEAIGEEKLRQMGADVRELLQRYDLWMSGYGEGFQNIHIRYGLRGACGFTEHNDSTTSFDRVFFDSSVGQFGRWIACVRFAYRKLWDNQNQGWRDYLTNTVWTDQMVYYAQWRKLL